jgi:aldehyde:ferredoxin oxidoreductase
MDRNDVKDAIDMFYDEMGWNRATGAPTSQAYLQVGLGKVAEALGKQKLLA